MPKGMRQSDLSKVLHMIEKLVRNVKNPWSACMSIRIHVTFQKLTKQKVSYADTFFPHV